VNDRHERRIEYMPLDELLGWPANSKDHDVGLIDTAIKRFGFVDPIVLCERTGRIAAGHGRQKTLHGMMLGREPVPEGIRVRADGMWLVPVARGWASKNDRELDAATVALNQATIAGGWDEPKLKDLLLAIGSQSEAGLGGVGFDPSDVEDLVANLDKQHGSADAPPLAEKPWLKRGDLFALGDHRLLCAQPTDRASINQLLRGEPIDVMLTEPLAGDVPARDYQALLSAVFDAWRPTLAYVVGPWDRWSLVTEAAAGRGYHTRAQIVWDTETVTGGRGWLHQHQLVACVTKGKVSFPQTPAHGDVVRVARRGDDMPFELAKELLHTTAPAIARTVADPGARAGATIIACEALGRTCYAMEPDPRRAQACVERWAQFTGLEPEPLTDVEDLQPAKPVAAPRVRSKTPSSRRTR
jgi:hypothetical protein